MCRGRLLPLFLPSLNLKRCYCLYFSNFSFIDIPFLSTFFPPFLIPLLLLLLLYTKFRKRLSKCSRFVFTSSRFVIERKLETKKKRDNGLIISKYRSRRTRQARYDLWTTITGKFFPRLKPERGERVRETGFSDNILP